jgi:beta-galactosidase
MFLCISAVAATPRKVQNINAGWKFFYGSATTSAGATEVNLPHTWNRDAIGGVADYFRGEGNYLKDIDIPATWEGGKVYIKFYGAGTVANLFINGHHAGEHRGAGTAFAFDITDMLHYGKRNSVWAVVSNARRLDVLPTAGDANVYGGLFRDAELIVTGSESITPTDFGSDGVYVTQKRVSRERVDAEVAVKVCGTKDNNNVQVQLAVYDADMRQVAEGQARVKLAGKAVSTAKIAFAIDKPTLWDGVRNPYLYNIAVKVLNGHTVTDSVAVRTGFRTFAVDAERGFLLNGEPYPLRGVVASEDRAMYGNALRPYQVREDVDIICGMGANAVRAAGAAHHPDFYRLCDERGIVVWSDFPLTGAAFLTDKSFIDTQAFRDNGLMQAREVMAQQYNNPSVAIWGIFADIDLRGDSPLDYISALNMAAHREGGGRMTGAFSTADGDINFITDLIVWDHFFGWKTGQPTDINVWREHYSKNWRNLRSGVSYAAGGSINQQEQTPSRPLPDGAHHPEGWQSRFHEEYLRSIGSDSLFWGIFVGNMFDYGAAQLSGGEGNGINDKGLVTFDRKYFKDAYWLYKANWRTDSPFVYIAERRLETRSGASQTIKVYSNCTEVELIVNGTSHGTATGSHGIFTWSDLPLAIGLNTITARSGPDIADTCEITVQ